MSNFHAALGDWTPKFGFSNSSKIVQSTIVLPSKLLRWKSKCCPIPQKTPNSHSNHQSPISKVQKLSTLKGTLPQDWLKLEH